MDNDNGKRQRTHQVNIFDIDDNLLSDISTYLAKEHRVVRIDETDIMLCFKYKALSLTFTFVKM